MKFEKCEEGTGMRKLSVVVIVALMILVCGCVEIKETAPGYETNYPRQTDLVSYVLMR